MKQLCHGRTVEPDRAELVALRGVSSGELHADSVSMFLILGLIFGVAWLLGLVVFNVTVAAFHVLLVLAVIGLVVHFASRPRTS